MPLPTARRLGDVDGVARVERPDLHDPDRQQRRAALAQRPRRSGVHLHGPVGRLGVLQPQLERRVARLAGGEAGPHALAGQRGLQRARAHAVGDDRRDAGRRGHLGGHDLRAHPARAERRRACPIRSSSSASKSVTSPTSSASGSRARVGGEQALDVGEHHEPVGADQDRHLRGEEVVVPEGDLVRRRRVVLVDDRHHAPVQQPPERLARVEVVRARAEVEEREQDLGAGHAAVAQQLVVDAVELALADGAGGLQVLDRGRAHAAGPSRRIPRAIAPEETTTTSSPAAQRARRPRRGAPGRRRAARPSGRRRRSSRA